MTSNKIEGPLLTKSSYILKLLSPSHIYQTNPPLPYLKLPSSGKVKRFKKYLKDLYINIKLYLYFTGMESL